MPACLRSLIIVFIATLTLYDCTVYQKPRPIHDVPFLERSQSKVDGEVRVTVAVLSAEESRQLFGVNLSGKGIQPKGTLVLSQKLLLGPAFQRVLFTCS